jgi:propanol-preferring alcohol dehydrogenase
MQAMRLPVQRQVEDQPLVLEDVEIPEPRSGQVRLRVLACGVCHTDLHTVEGDISPPQLPVTPGHQVVGVVDAIGEGVKAKLALGDRVGVPWLYATCGMCAYCQSGRENLCPEARFTGYHIDGGYASYMVAEANFVLRIPDEINEIKAAPLLCAGIIGYRSLRLADLNPGERIGLVGFGASAHLAIQVAHHWNCEVYVFTRSNEHRQLANELGAAWVGGAEDNAPNLLDRAVIFAPAGDLVPIILEKLKPAGTLAINAIHMSPIPEMPYRLIYGERTLRSVSNATYQDGVDFLKLAVEIPIMVTTMPYELQKANQALLDLKRSRINGEAVLIIGN